MGGSVCPLRAELKTGGIDAISINKVTPVGDKRSGHALNRIDKDDE